MREGPTLNIPRSITVLIDNREKDPLPMPAFIPWFLGRELKPHIIKITTKASKLGAGDYAIEGNHQFAIIERKGSLRELASNFLSADWPRFQKAIEKFVDATDHPILLVEGGYSDLTSYSGVSPQASRFQLPDPHCVLDILNRIVVRYNLQLTITGPTNTIAQRRMVGEFALRMLLNHTYETAEIEIEKELLEKS